MSDYKQVTMDAVTEVRCGVNVNEYLSQVLVNF